MLPRFDRSSNHYWRELSFLNEERPGIGALVSTLILGRNFLQYSYAHFSGRSIKT